MKATRRWSTVERIHTHTRHMLACALLLLGGVAPASAEPLLFTFSGVIPQLTTFSMVQTTNQDGTLTTDTSVTTLLDVSFEGRATFDSSIWALTSPVDVPSFIPSHELNEVDPTGGSGTGVETPERISASLDIGSGVGTLLFDRHLVDMPNLATVDFPYEGSTSISYQDGLEGLTVFTPPLEVGDAFAFNLLNSFGGTDTGGSFDGEVSRLLVSLFTSFNFLSGSFELQNMFGAGPPLAFSWIDPNPSLGCSGIACLDGYAGFGQFSHSTLTFTSGPLPSSSQVGRSGNLMIHRADLAPLAVPEPASMSLLAVGIVATALVRRRRAK